MTLYYIYCMTSAKQHRFLAGVMMQFGSDFEKELHIEVDIICANFQKIEP